MGQDNDILLSQISFSELVERIRKVVRLEIESAQQRQIEEKLLSVKEVCEMFRPKISRPTLDSIVKSGQLAKRHFGGRVVFKYSEVMNCVKTFKPYKKSDQHVG